MHSHPHAPRTYTPSNNNYSLPDHNIRSHTSPPPQTAPSNLDHTALTKNKPLRKCTMCHASFITRALLGTHVRTEILIESDQSSKPHTTAKSSLQGFSLCKKCEYPFLNGGVCKH